MLALVLFSTHPFSGMVLHSGYGIWCNQRIHGKYMGEFSVWTLKERESRELQLGSCPGLASHMHTSKQLKRGRDFALPAELSLSLFFESKLSVPRSALVSSVSRRAYLYAPSLTSRVPLPLLRRFFLLRPLLSLPCREREGENSERPSSERENRRWGTSAVAPGRLMWPRISGHLAQVRRAGLKNPFLFFFLL